MSATIGQSHAPVCKHSRLARKFGNGSCTQEGRFLIT